MNALKQKIYACQCQQCRAVYRLIEVHGAELIFSEKKAGRLCELAVVAAEETAGISESAVVAARRAYAKHLDVNLAGPTSNAEQPVHIAWAVNNSSHNPAAKNRINLGNASASYLNGRYFLQ